MKVGVVVCNPARREEAMFTGNMLAEGMMEVLGGVRGDSVVEMVEGILEMEDRGVWNMRGLSGVKGEGSGGGWGG